MSVSASEERTSSSWDKLDILGTASISSAEARDGMDDEDAAREATWKPVSEADMMIVHVIMPKAEEAAAPAAEGAAAVAAAPAAPAEPEVIKKGKKEEAEEGEDKKK